MDEPCFPSVSASYAGVRIADKVVSSDEEVPAGVGSLKLPLSSGERKGHRQPIHKKYKTNF